MPSLIPQRPWARRLVYELIYAWPFSRQATSFNVGFAPASHSIRSDPDFAHQPNQIQLYAELFGLAPLDAEGWRDSSIIEVAAGCGGGLLYLRKHYRPREAIGIDASSAAGRRGRRIGVDLRQGDAANLPFEDQRFDCLVCVDALNYFPEKKFIGEAFRVMEPGGRMLFGESAGASAAAEDRFRRIASIGGLELEHFRDASVGVRLSIEEAGPGRARAISWFPAFIRRRLEETMTLQGSERYGRWQSGVSGFAMAILRRPIATA